MKLFLSGGGVGSKSEELDRRFVIEADKSKPMLYIPIGINECEYPYSDCFEYIIDKFNPLGLREIEIWSEEDIQERASEGLDRFGSIYIDDGNAFYLLKNLQDSGLTKKIRQMAKNNVPVYGCGSGAVVCARTLIPRLEFDVNDCGLRDMDALNLVGEYDVWCHYEPDMSDQVLDYSKRFGLKRLVLLPDDAGLQVSNKNMESVGPGSAQFFSEKRN